MIPMELPNKRFPSPPPFMFHPELQPDLAARNLKNFVPFEIPRSKYRRNRNPQTLGASAVPDDQVKRFVMP